MPPSWGALILFFCLALPTTFADGAISDLHTKNESCTDHQVNRTELLNNIYTCNNNGSNCDKVERNASYILLKNIMNTMEKIDENTHREFRTAVRQLLERISACNPILLKKMMDSTGKFNLFVTTDQCVIKEQVCLQNQLYLYPMFCTAREHLFDFAPKLNYKRLLQLYYGVGYAFQMINAQVNGSLECNRLYDVLPIHFQNEVKNITGKIMIDEKRLCRHYSDYYYDLDSDMDNPNFKECQNGESEKLARLGRKIEAFMENCSKGMLKALNEDNL